MKNFSKILLGSFVIISIAAIFLFETSPKNIFNVDKKSKIISQWRSTKDSIVSPKYFKEKGDSILDNSILLNDFIGISSGVYKAGIGSYLGNAGYKNKFSRSPSDPNTQYRIASISKSFTAIAIMQLWEKKLISLDVSIQTYLPEFPTKPEGTITIRQLLKHTSGIKHYSSMWDGISYTHYNNLIEALDEFKDRPLSFMPGTAYEYTTYGYTILGAIIEKVGGQSFNEYMQTHIFSPAKMYHTTTEDAMATYDNKANLYIKLGGKYIKSPRTDLSVKAAGGGLISTANDLLKFGKAVLEHQLIDSTTLVMMINSTDTLKRGVPYGFGWFVMEDEKNGRVIHHGGSQSGCSSFFQILLDQKIVSAALSNNFGSDNEVYWLSRDLANLLTKDSSTDHSINYFNEQPKAVLKKYVGSYQHEGGVFNITRKGNQLFGQTKHYSPLPIFPNSENEFFFRHFDGKYSFEKSNKGILQLIYHDGARLTISNRIES